MILYLTAGGAVVIALLVFLVLSKLRVARYRTAAVEAMSVPELGASLSSADHLWLHRSLNSEPTLHELDAQSIDGPKALHAALLRSSAEVSAVKRGPAQRARRAAEVRSRRQDLMAFIPNLEQATSATFPMLDAVLLQAIEAAPAGLFSSLISVGVDHNKLLDLVPHDALADGVGAAGENFLHAVADAHIPVLTIVSSVNRYRTAANNGLDSQIAISEGAWEIALRGGGVTSGATIGAHAIGTFVPIVGHIVGAGLGALGGLLGSKLNARRQEQPLREADAALRARLVELGTRLPSKAWSTFSDESWQIITDCRDALTALSAELDESLTWWQRHVRPTFVDVAFGEAIRCGLRDIEAECEQALAFDEIVGRMSADGDGQAYLAAIAIARPAIRAELGLDDDAIKPVNVSIDAVTTERKRLALLRG